MSEITKDVRNIWKRLFDHTHFLNGEINFLLNEFEVKRGDKEVNELFLIVENITDLKDTQIGKVNKILDTNLQELNENLAESLSLSKRILDLEGKYKEDSTLETSRDKRKIIWDQFMSNITEKYSEINNSYEQKENNLRIHYTDITKQTHH
ncbi:hypothetical protein HHI36_023450 [Cryptolaemus montrouzieri]|uniref:Biogenesis of lysosome-related organelles complex 1 subunit 5 n=1 Tax=Cryptolaemus montrouzieri TaxID=559131 RepID=A0ABD2PH65_9CUCU